MRRAASLVVLVAVAGVALAALVFELWPRGESPEAGSRPESSSDQPLPLCRTSQLRVALETLGGSPVVVLRHVGGGPCRVGRLRASIKIRDQRGEPVPISSLRKTFSGEVERNVELVGGLVYLASCDQQGPLKATATVGTLTANGTLPSRGCIQTHSRVIRLGAGRDGRFFLIQAPGPRRAFSIRVRLPHTARVAVSIQTTGPVLRVLDGASRGDCERQGNEDVCVRRFPTLGGSSTGQWTVRVEKRSRPPATVRFRITSE